MEKILANTHPLISTKQTRKKKQHNTPKKWDRVVHPVGYYKGHLKQARRFYNHLDKIKPEGQVSSATSRGMANPKPLSIEETAALESKGVVVKNGFVVSR